MRPSVTAFILVAFLLVPGPSATGQPLRMRPADRLMVEFIGDNWRNLPGNMRQNFINRGVFLMAMQDVPLGTSRFSLAAGLAFYSHNLYSDHRFQLANGVFGFVPILREYQKNKLNLNYLGMPLELRFRGPDRRQGLRLYGGVSADYLLNAKTKFRGLDQAGSREVRLKEHIQGQFNPFRLQAYARAGLGNWGVTARFTLTRIFEVRAAQDMMPVSFGLSWSLY